MVNPKLDFGCAAYCKYAEECIGRLPEGLAEAREHILKNRMSSEKGKNYKRDKEDH
jgi:hypothetical protein